jgi:hypothetical protein
MLNYKKSSLSMLSWKGVYFSLTLFDMLLLNLNLGSCLL